MACPCGCGARSMWAGAAREELQNAGQEIAERQAADVAKKTYRAIVAQAQADYNAMLASIRLQATAARLGSGRPELDRRR